MERLKQNIAQFLTRTVWFVVLGFSLLVSLPTTAPADELPDEKWLQFDIPWVRTPNYRRDVETGKTIDGIPDVLLNVYGITQFRFKPTWSEPNNRVVMLIQGTGPELPGWLLALLQDEIKSPGHSIAYWQQLVKEGIGEGERNDTIASLTGHLLWHGVDTDVVMELLLCWNRVRCSPPLDDDEVIRTVQSITRLHQQHE